MGSPKGLCKMQNIWMHDLLGKSFCKLWKPSEVMHSYIFFPLLTHDNEFISFVFSRLTLLTSFNVARSRSIYCRAVRHIHQSVHDNVTCDGTLGPFVFDSLSWGLKWIIMLSRKNKVSLSRDLVKTGTLPLPRGNKWNELESFTA